MVTPAMEAAMKGPMYSLRENMELNMVDIGFICASLFLGFEGQPREECRNLDGGPEKILLNL